MLKSEKYTDLQVRIVATNNLLVRRQGNPYRNLQRSCRMIRLNQFRENCHSWVGKLIRSSKRHKRDTNHISISPCAIYQCSTQATTYTSMDYQPCKLEPNKGQANCDRNSGRNLFEHMELRSYLAHDHFHWGQQFQRDVNWLRAACFTTEIRSPVEHSKQKAWSANTPLFSTSETPGNKWHPTVEHSMPTKKAANNSNMYIFNHIVRHVSIIDGIRYTIPWHAYATADDKQPNSRKTYQSTSSSAIGKSWVIIAQPKTQSKKNSC